MQFKLLNIGYLEGARVVTVTLCADDSAGNAHPIQAQWLAADVPELDSLFRKAIEQVGGDLALMIDDANAVLRTTTAAPNSVSVDTTSDAALHGQVEGRKQELLKERAAEAERAAPATTSEGVQ